MVEGHTFPGMAGHRKDILGILSAHSLGWNAQWRPVVKEEAQAMHGGGGTASVAWHPKVCLTLWRPAEIQGFNSYGLPPHGLFEEGFRFTILNPRACPTM